MTTYVIEFPDGYWEEFTLFPGEGLCSHLEHLLGLKGNMWETKLITEHMTEVYSEVFEKWFIIFHNFCDNKIILMEDEEAYFE